MRGPGLVKVTGLYRGDDEASLSDSLLFDLIRALKPGQRLCLLPITRVFIEEAGWLSEDIAIFPPGVIDPEKLRVVEWPERTFSELTQRGYLAGEDALHWGKSGATRIDLPDFFESALVALPVTLDWDAFLMPESHEAHLDMIRAAAEMAERTFDLLRFEGCPLWVPQKLPGRVGLLGDTSFSAALFYTPEDHESYIVAGQILTHQIIIGIGLDLTGAAVAPLADGEVGAILTHALRLYTDALEAASETSRFVQMISLIEFLADPGGYLAMKKAKQQIARAIAGDLANYEAIIADFLYLTSEAGAAKGANAGLRHNIVHCGKRLEDLTTAAERQAIFQRLAHYAGMTMAQMRDDAALGWEAVEARRTAGARRLGLTPLDQTLP